MRRDGVAILLAILLSGPAMAATWYASPDGTGDGSAEGTPMAWADIADDTSNGDTIRIVDMDSTISKPEAVWVSNRSYETKRFSWYDQISMTMDAYYPISRAANGDFFVDGPISMVSSDPAWDGTKNGIQIDPDYWQDGLDSRNAGYNASYNVADDMLSSPVSVSAGQSVVLAVGQSSNNGGYLATAAVLTVVDSLPSAGSFRPVYTPYTGRAVEYNISDLDVSFLPSHTFSEIGTVHKDTYTDWTNREETIERLVERVHLDHMRGQSTTRQNAAVQNADDYPADHGRETAAVMMALCSDERTDALVYRAVQRGLDYIGMHKAGCIWVTEEGLCAFRAGIMLFAARALQDETLEEYVLDFVPEDGPAMQCYHVAESQCWESPYYVNYNGATYVYTTGTVTVQNGSTTVEGSGVNWTVASPRFFAIAGDDQGISPFGRVYQCTVADSDTLTLERAYTGDSGGSKSYTLASRLCYGHGKLSKVGESSGDSWYDYGEYVDEMIGLPDWSGQHGIEGGEYNEGPNMGAYDWGTMAGTYRYVAYQQYTGNTFALYLMGLSDEYVTACGDRRVLDSVDRYVEYSEQWVDVWAAGESAFFKPAWAYELWGTLRPSYGSVWSAKPTTPSPADDATDVSTSQVLSWTEKTGTYGVKLYLGTTSPLDEEDLVGVVTAEEYDPDLSADTTYYWRVDYWDTGENQVEGIEWSFTTDDGSPPAGTKYILIRSGS